MAKKNFDFKKDYPHFLEIQTRWMDNDVYGHVNNVVYYSYFDTVVNRYLIDQGVLDIQQSEVIGVVVETLCAYRKSFAFPQKVLGGLRVSKLGKSSVRYEIGLFSEEDDQAHSCGYFVHAYVKRETNKPTALPTQMRTTLEKIYIEPEE